MLIINNIYLGGIAVILGPTGRNFAAGMSGGIAYIFDSEGNFSEKCNKNTVDILPLELDEDIEFLVDILVSSNLLQVNYKKAAFRTNLYILQNEFYDSTGSQVARRILDTFETSKSLFKKVFPQEYQRALLELAVEREKEAKKKATLVRRLTQQSIDSKKFGFLPF